MSMFDWISATGALRKKEGLVDSCFKTFGKWFS